MPLVGKRDCRNFLISLNGNNLKIKSDPTPEDTNINMTDKEVGPSPYIFEFLDEKSSGHPYLYQILEETPNGVLIVSLDHRIIHANPSACRFLNVSFEKLKNQHLREFLGPENTPFLDSIKSFLESSVDDEEQRVREEIIITAPAKERRVLDVVLVSPPSTPEHYILYLIDVTTRKNLEGELRRHNAFFQNLIDSSVDGIIAADTKGRIILFNQGAQALLGYTEEEALSSLNATGLYPEGFAYEVIKRMRSYDFGGRGKLLRHQLIVKEKTGHEIPVSFSGGIIYDRNEEVATFGIFTDLRAMMKIEEDLEQTHNMLMQSEKMAGLGRLAAGVAHEINNPMSGIMLYANFVQEDLGEEHPSNKDLKTIIHEAERCKVIVGDLLEFSHQKTYDMSPVDLNEVIQKTLGVLQNQPSFHNIDIILNLTDSLAPIMGNSIRLNQVIMNILVNAAQAMDGNGSLTIQSRTRANQDINEIIINDTGPGIPQKTLEKIFEPFFTTKETGEGTGLGLSVSYAIVKEHKGNIRAASTPESGTTFTLRFPAVMETLIGEDNEH